MLLSELEFGAFLSYSPRGQDDVSRNSQVWVRRLKDERHVGTPPMPMSEYVARRLQQRLSETKLGDILSSSALLVPIPPSTLLKNASLWVPFLLAKAMVRHGLGSEVEPCLERVTALRKAATSAASDRPLALHHYESMNANRLAFPHDEVVLVDDVVTRGATMLAAASRLRDVLPGARIRGFAMVRTISDRDNFQGMLDPCIGFITLREDGQTFRRP